MKTNFRLYLLIALFLLAGVAVLLGVGHVLAQGPIGTNFTYQGQLKETGVLANGPYDFQFTLYEAAAGGFPVGSTLTLDDVGVTDGLFTVDLDFGDVFDGGERWLEIAVRPGDSAGAYTTLSPRQALTAAPYALHARRFWKLGGNSNVGAGDYLGTSNNQSLELRVNGQRALLLIPDATSPNIIGGYSGNSVDAGVHGAVISGGGESDHSNSIYDHYGVIGGGYGNVAGSDDSDPGTAMYATAGGGYGNAASDDYSTVGGGEGNTASGSHSTVSGGDANTASGDHATAPGGFLNTASGAYSFAAGASANATHPGSFVWSSAESTSSWGNNTFTVRAHGGARFYTASGTSIGAQLPSGSGSWSSLSDRNVKENFDSVDGEDLLARLARIPILTWNYKAQDPAIRHMGPMAQDFYAAFGLGEDDRHISTIDADGVALAAIQALYQQNRAQSARITRLEQENKALQTQVDDLETRLAALEAAIAAMQADSARARGE